MDWQNCRWLGTDETFDSPVILRRFHLENSRKATLFITGLGYFDAQINGVSVTDQWFLPVPTDYEPRDLTALGYPLRDHTTNRIYFYQFDITPLLRSGENLLTIQLGNGFYRQTERTAEGPTSFGAVLKAIYRMEIETADGTRILISDGSETQRDSEIRYNNLFYGEVIDYTHPLSAEKPVSILPAPPSLLTPAIGTPDRQIRTILPVLLGKKDGRKIYDVGENISGIVTLHTNAPAGSRITLRFAEECLDDETLDFSSAGSGYISATGKPQIQEDVFITDGQSRTFRQRFVWHGFRYFEAEGPFEKLEVCVIHSDTPITASFTSSLEGPQFLFDAFLRTQLANMHGSYPSDCPHRERLGYLGDGQVCAPAAMMMLDSRAFYEKWMQDILDGQDNETGHVQHTAPLMGGGGGPGVWGSAVVFLPYAYYKQYGDASMLEKCYPAMLRWVDYLLTRREDGLITREEEGGWCLGDWCTLEPIRISTSYVNTCCFIKILSLMEEMALVINRAQEIARLQSLRQSAEEAVRRHFYDPATGHYDVTMQGADAYAVWCGLAGSQTMQQVAAAYDQLGHFDTGFMGTDLLLELLFEHGYGDTALKLLESRTPGSFLYMKDHGATTLWEYWTGEYSHNHPMFGGGARHLFTGILGIRQRKGTAGYQDVIIHPCRLPTGNRVSGNLQTPLGELFVQLDDTTVTVKAPEGMRISFAEDELTHRLV